MILTVTPNVAIDRTYIVERLELGAVHKPSRIVAQVGGKGVNVSRTIACLGYPTVATGLFGGAGVAAAQEELQAVGVEAELFAAAGPPRQTVTVTVAAQDGPTTAFDEPGPTVTEAEWGAFERHVASMAGRACWVVLSGSLPPGAPETGYGRLLARVVSSDRAAIIDARGRPLRAALTSGPSVVKLNRTELSETLGSPCETESEAIEGARVLQALGAERVIVTFGAKGAIATDRDEVWRVSHPSENGNPIGAGDAFTAGVAVTLSKQQPFAEALREGAAVALASLRSPVAGHVEPDDVAAARREVTTQAVAAGGATAMTTFILAVDHRASLRRWLASLGVSSEHTDRSARELKTLCVRALDAAASGLRPTETPMLLLDETYGVDAIAEARARGLRFVIPAERSGLPEFEFEHGDGFGDAIEAVDPDAVKALVRYNPDGDAAANRRSRAGLRRLQEYLGEAGRPFILELLVPPTAEQTRQDGDRYDDEHRPALTVTAIDELAADGLRPDWWKLEGNRKREPAALVAEAAMRASHSGCLVLGRGQDRDQVLRWLATAAALPGYDGFAVGRTLWRDAFAERVAGAIDEQEAIDRIAGAYLDVAADYRQHETEGTEQMSNPSGG